MDGRCKDGSVGVWAGGVAIKFVIVITMIIIIITLIIIIIIIIIIVNSVTSMTFIGRCSHSG